MNQPKSQSQSLHELAEAADLVRMIEDLTSPSNVENLSSSSWSGMRITLRQIRETISSSHAVLASDLIARSKAQADHDEDAIQDAANGKVPTSNSATSTGQASNASLTRTDLKASLERYID